MRQYMRAQQMRLSLAAARLPFAAVRVLRAAAGAVAVPPLRPPRPRPPPRPASAASPNASRAAGDCPRTFSTIKVANCFPLSMKAVSDACPRAMAGSRFSQWPVISGEVSRSTPAARISSMAMRPFCVTEIRLPVIST